MAIFAKIAVELADATAKRTAAGDAAAPLTFRSLASGQGWSVEDVICTSGPHDRPIEEQHRQFSVALVVAGTFQYRGASDSERTGQLMTPGSLFLGNPGQGFECTHEHGRGDRCLSFHFSPEFFEETAADSGVCRSERRFSVLRLPASREMSPLVARACAGMIAAGNPVEPGSLKMWWEEMAIHMAAGAIQQANRTGGKSVDPLPSVSARITRAVRKLEDDQQAEWNLQELAAEAGLSPFHFLRTFEQVTGLTPHQYVRRMRLRKAAARLLSEQSSILDVVMECGFGDLSNFNRAFRNEFGMPPRQFRKAG